MPNINRNSVKGAIGVAVGGFWLIKNFQHFEQQGFVAIGMPLIVFGLGAFYLLKGLKAEA